MSALNQGQLAGLTEDEVSLWVCQTVMPVSQIVSQVELLSRPEAGLRSFVRLPYLISAGLRAQC